ncbi:MAG TPA: glycosyltransferase family 4 protein [Candidatus Agrococcus pullicola]|uniref:D-inositol 3-phosphate glycosyltransferase n=1 Tax=Candidatus Agrococcus pullicola TaxID=2838429 RepID=A0A9D1YWF5_9MICO|nr:glycosyltransferase family 4 protein [Candidatus Agrococcus pullicola]
MMEKKRILHVTQVYAGGISRAITSLVDLMPDAEHHLLWAGNEQPDASIPYASVHAMPQSPRAILSAIRRVRRVVAEVRPNVVHAHSSFGGVYTRLANLDVPVFYEPHCYKFDDGQQPAPMRTAFRLAEKALARRSARTIVLSPHEERLARSLDSRAYTHFLPNVATIRPSASFPATAFATARNVFMIGRLTNQKDPDYFAQVAEATHRLASDVTFRWIGDVDGEDDGRGESLRERLTDAGVDVLGWLTGDDLAAEMSRPALYFHSAHYEGFPLSLLDAAIFEHPLAVRGIPTFDGMGIPEATEPMEAAQLIVEILDDGPRRRLAIAAAHRLNQTMSHEAQRDSLRTLYASA